MFYMLSDERKVEYITIQVDAKLIDPASEKEKVEYKLENMLYYSLCDMLSVDFRMVASDIARILLYALERKISNPPYNEIFETLKKHSLLLCDSNVIRDLGLIIGKDGTRENKPQTLNTFERNVFHCFHDFMVLKRYIIRTISNKNLLEIDIYHEFANRFLGVKFAKYDDGIYLLDLDFAKSMKEERLDFTIDSFVKSIRPSGSPNVYGSDKHIEAIAYMFKALLQNSHFVKKCENCGKYFVPYNRSDTIYCDRKSPQDPERTCKEYGTQRLWYDKMQGDEALKLYRNVYSAKRMMVRRNPNIPNYKKNLEEFSVQAAEWKAKYKSGVVTSEEFINWLNSEKLRKV
ncbi:MAG: hypothetical protein GX824_01030 [Clostridiales bacterium]|nr:hypothetical protein [Clostridiales bacterium]